MKEDFESIKEAPSHILADGNHIYLPKSSKAEKAAFFAQTVASYKLVHADEKQETAEKEVDKEDKKKEDDEVMNIHPLHLASARLRTNGIDELSKAVNLATLVQSGEYFAFNNIIDSSLQSSSSTTAAGGNANAKPSTAASQTAQAKTDEQEEEMILRSKYILNRKRKQYSDATDTFLQHYKRLQVVTSAQKVVDQRYLQLRKRWKLSAPEHGNVVQAPVRPNETIAIDVDIYSGKASGGGIEANGKGGTVSTLGKIARMVPRYATIELGDDFGVNDLVNYMKQYEKEHEDDDGNDVEMKDVNSIGNEDIESYDEEKELTVAKAFAVADPTLGSVDLNRFDPDDVPLLTLYFQIQKSSTGFVHSVALSSFVDIDHESQKVKNGKKVSNGQGQSVEDIILAITKDKTKPRNDELIIQSLQHSLFCANLFDSIRKEVTSVQKSRSVASMVNGKRIGSQSQNQAQMKQSEQQPAWLSSDMEENFLPPPSLMASGDAIQKRGRGFDVLPLSVIHCHEGEVKVQLNSEYAMNIKLVDSKNSRETIQDSVLNENKIEADENLCGSQSREELDVLCRQLLLHAQFVFHDHHKQRSRPDRDQEVAPQERQKIDYSTGIARNTTNVSRNVLIKEKKVEEMPNILQSCVALGNKVIFERKVRVSLEVSPSFILTVFTCL